MYTSRPQSGQRACGPSSSPVWNCWPHSQMTRIDTGRPPLRRARPRARTASTRQLGPDGFERLLEGGGDAVGVLAAGLGEVGPSATAAADDRRHLLEPLAGVQAARD